jgi:hypothetical protein
MSAATMALLSSCLAVCTPFGRAGSSMKSNDYKCEEEADDDKLDDVEGFAQASWSWPMRRRSAEGGWASMAGSKLLTSWEAEALLLKFRTWASMVSCVMMRWPVKVRWKFMSFPVMRSIEPRRWRRHIV